MDGKLDAILKELDDLYQNAPCGYHSLDSNGYFMKINDTELGWLGLSRGEVVGRLRLPDIVFPEDRPISMRAFERLLGGETVEDLEVRLLRRDGTPLPVLVNANAQRDESGNFLMSRSVLTDISRQSKAEMALQALLENAEKCSAVIAAIADGILLLDTDGIVFDCNPSAERILGQCKETLAGKSFEKISANFIREDGSPFPREELPPIVTLETGQSCADVVMGLPKQESVIWVKLDCKVLFSKRHPFAIMVSFADISERKRQQEELQHSYSALRELSFRLEHAREVERANIAREIHDELGSTLTSIKFDLSWATEKNGDRARFEEIFRGLDAAIRSVKKICTSLRPSILDDLGLLAALEWQLQQFGRKTGIRCRLETGGSEPELPQDVATGIFRIFQETLTNVARHAEASSVLVEFHSNDKDILLTVTDDGKGIDSKKSSGSKSLGIVGMTERAQALGGALSVRPARPTGTRVKLSVPLERRTSDRISAASTP